ncbi:hypothetical protein VTJ83DRAFT_6645 [Remersonia thermophila]|uniref:Uncharacterized protein n=1 Tax=Remersonia thermophila TaxID=72144 RepID=A0ABR4D656_9PEZI
MATTAAPDQQPAPKLVTNEAGFQAFDTYPWTSDRDFLKGLMMTLGPANLNPKATATDGFHRQRALSTALQARIWWYTSRFNLQIDQTAYLAYTLANPSSSPDARILARLEEIAQRMAGINTGAGGDAQPAAAPTTSPTPAVSSPQPPAASDSSAAQPAAQGVPAWQLNAPKVDLSKKADDAGVHNAAPDGTPYPENFQAIVEAVTLGRPIPGIKEIPDIVERPPGITPFGKLKPPRKPWEKDEPADPAVTSVTALLGAGGGIFGDVPENEFPPLPETQQEGDEAQEQQDEQARQAQGGGGGGGGGDNGDGQTTSAAGAAAEPTATATTTTTAANTTAQGN